VETQRSVVNEMCYSVTMAMTCLDSQIMHHTDTVCLGVDVRRTSEGRDSGFIQ
jgi:hypothetical protein